MREALSTQQPAESANDRRIVVMGGLGFMGSFVCRSLVKRGYPVRIFDKLYARRKLIEDIADRVEIIEGDISRADDVLTALKGCHTAIDLVHTTVPGSSMKDPAYDVASNVVAAANWFPRLNQTGISRFFYVSSGGTVYGVPKTIPIHEDHPTNPISSYGITKLTLEKYVAMYCNMLGIEHRILRPSNVYGEGQRLNIGQGVIGVMANLALRGQPLEIWGTGESERDYLHVDDFASAVLALLDYKGSETVFNVSSEEGRSVLDIVSALKEILGNPLGVRKMPERGFDVPFNVLSSARLRNQTGWTQQVNFQSGIARTVKWLEDQSRITP
ncbi:MAG TPA: NAD-dependent epimerase/dehydratase family protein [Pyrinomonadaceae bacterium]|jgi:Nucleoside-diphosphate-sugar epimerases|nr:NAD-dependent epimerase/dehydratase family protein [Pyrinomonadaceae bacterium]